MGKKINDLDGWKPVGWANPMPKHGWVLLKRPGEMPKAYLADRLPRALELRGMYWKLAVPSST